MIALFCFLGLIVSGYTSPISVTADEREAFAQKLLNCVKEKRSRDAVLNESVNDCLKEAIEDLRPFMSTGIPSLDLKPTDPLTIDNIDLNRDIPPFTIRTKLDNVIARGLSKFVTRKVATDMKKKTLQIVITIPKLFIEGDYKTNSQLAVVTVKGEGPFTANLTKVTGDGRATIKVVCKDIAGYDTKQQVMMVENSKFDFNIAKSSMKLENLFDGQKALAKVAGDFLNSEEFNKMVQKEVKPQILTEVNELFERVVNSALGEFPVSDYLEETGHSIEC